MTKEMYNTKRTELTAKAQAFIDDGKLEESAKVRADIEKLNTDYENACKEQANLSALSKTSASPITNQLIEGGKNSMENKIISKAEMFASDEYRRAFMDFVANGKAIPAEYKNTAAQTATTDVAAVIPTTIIQKIYAKLETYGRFYNLATKTSYKGGVSVPTSSAVLTASWVAERGTSDTQKVATGSVTFTYRKLICKVALTFETGVTTLDIFENFVVEQISKAMIKAIEKSMFDGVGEDGNEMEGILEETVVIGQNVDIAEGNGLTYETLLSAESKVPDEYDAGSVWVMRKSTYYNQVLSLKDSVGQPIARTNVGIDGKPEMTILGRPVMFSENVPAFASAVAADTIVAFIFNFADYVINTNYSITLRQYIDEATDDTVQKSIALLDGKVVDKNSLVTVTIKNS